MIQLAPPQRQALHDALVDAFDLRALAQAKDEVAVAGKVGEFRALFGDVQEQTEVLAAYKNLHDGLHNLERRLASIEAAAQLFTTAAAQAKLLAREVVNLREDAR